MAVYTHLDAAQLEELISAYDVGELVSAKGIAEGVSNSNWLIETTGKRSSGARFILTMYERRIQLSDLPFFLSLLDHLASKDCPVPRTIPDRDGASFRMIDDKAVALIEYLPGLSVDHPTSDQAHSVGKALAQMHLAVTDFEQSRYQSMGLAEWDDAVHRCGTDLMAEIDPELPDFAYDELSWLAGEWPGGLPHGVVHCDLFPDNVLMLNNDVSGLIDFYFAATDFFAYDLAVTHAAWSFERGGHIYRPEIGQALISGYQSIRPLSLAEWDAMPALLRGACMRFVTSRAIDWIETPDDAQVIRKDPMGFVRRSQFYARSSAELFAEQRHG